MSAPRLPKFTGTRKTIFLGHADGGYSDMEPPFEFQQSIGSDDTAREWHDFASAVHVELVALIGFAPALELLADARMCILDTPVAG
jgi:hypothetical protein